MTAQEFEQEYAERSGVTVEWLRQYRTVLPCRCGENDCPGWQSVSYELAADPFVRMKAGLVDDDHEAEMIEQTAGPC